MGNSSFKRVGVQDANGIMGQSWLQLGVTDIHLADGFLAMML